MKDVYIKQFIIATFVISWLGILPALLISYGVAIPNGFKSLQILMTLGPLLTTLFFVYKANGRKGLKQLFGKFLKLRVPLLVAVLAIGIPIVLPFIGAYVGLQLADMPWPEAYTVQHILSNGLMVFALYLIINTEEIAWRGVVFDQLFDRYGYIKACLILAPIWWLFHIPLFLFPGGHMAGYGIGVFTLMVFAMTFIIGWIYIRGKRSLFYVHITHQLFNGFGEAFPLFPVFIGGVLYPTWVMAVLLVLVALVIVYKYKATK